MSDINKGFGLLFEMGCGKTLTALAIAGAGYEMGYIEKVLIIAPTSVVAVWPKEFKEFAEFKYTCKTLLGAKKERIKALDDLMQFPFKAMKVAVINYESTWREGIKEKLQEFDADLIICDESQRIKTHDAAQSKTLILGGYNNGKKRINNSRKIQSCNRNGRNGRGTEGRAGRRTRRSR